MEPAAAKARGAGAAMAGDRDGGASEQQQPLLGVAEAPPKRRSTLLTVCPFILGALPVQACAAPV